MAEYSLPSWLQSDPTANAKTWLTGLQAGAAIGEARNRLAAQQQQFAVEAQQKSDQVTASALKEAQELQVSKAYNDQQVALKQQQLKIADEKVGAEIQKAARQFQAQQAYQKQYSDNLASGMTQDDAAKDAAFRHLVGESGGRGGFSMPSSLFKQPTPTQPVATQVRDSQGRTHTILTHGGVMTDIDRNLGRGQSIDPMQRFQMQQESKLQAEYRAELRKQMARLQKQQDEDLSGATAAEAVQGGSKDANAIKRATPYLQRASELKRITDQHNSLLQSTQDWQSGYSPVQRGQPQPTAGVTAAGVDAVWDPKTRSAVPVQGKAQPQSQTQPQKSDEDYLNEVLQRYPSEDTSQSQAATPAAQSAPQAAATKDTGIPGISATKPLSAAEKAAREKFFLPTEEEIKAGREKQQAQIKAQTYAETKKDAYSLYTGMKAHQANPEAASVTQQTWNEQLSQLKELLSKLTPEDRNALTGQNDLE